MSQNNQDDRFPVDVRIQISSEQVVRSLGSSIPIAIRYANQGNGTLSFREPAKTWEVHLLIGRPKQERKEVGLGRIFYQKSGDIVRRTVEKAQTVNLAAGAQYEFVYDAGQRWPELFSPGVNLLSLKDVRSSAGEAVSNTLEIRVAYDSSTYPKLLEILGDDTSTADSRQFAAEWIKQVHPGFDMERGGIGEARIWWTKHANDPATMKRMEELNRQAIAR